MPTIPTPRPTSMQAPSSVDPNAAILAALRALVDAGAPQTPVVSGPRPPVMSASPRKPTVQPEGGEILGRTKTIIDLLSALPLGLLGDPSNPLETLNAAGPVAGKSLLKLGDKLKTIPTGPRPRLAVRGGLADDVERELRARLDIDDPPDRLRDLLEGHIRSSTDPAQRLPFTTADAKTGFYEDEFREALKDTSSYYERPTSVDQYLEAVDPHSGQQLLPRMGKNPHIFVDSAISERRANAMAKEVLEGMALQKEVTQTPFRGPEQIRLVKLLDDGYGAWNDSAKTLIVAQNADPRRTSAHEMRHAFQYDRPTAARKIDPNMWTTPYYGPGSVLSDYAEYRAHPREVDAFAAENIAELLGESKAVGQLMLPPEYLLEMARAYERGSATKMDALSRVPNYRPKYFGQQMMEYVRPKQLDLPLDQERLKSTILGIRSSKR